MALPGTGWVAASLKRVLGEAKPACGMSDVALAVVARREEALRNAEVGSADQEADPLLRVLDHSGELDQ